MVQVLLVSTAKELRNLHPPPLSNEVKVSCEVVRVLDAFTLLQLPFTDKVRLVHDLAAARKTPSSRGVSIHPDLYIEIY